ncbi:7631_t:CDS:10 [Rhizophagus irregularis]|nr:7631_t:CDS:10 [Rhizophagus irregularis]
MADTLATHLAGIKHIIIVLSGKGGVGKSSITTQLALCLVQRGNKVGILDIDLTGPSIPHMLGLDGKQVHQASSGWVPVFADENQNLCCMSIGFLLQNKNDSVVWRGPKKNAMIKQFLADVCWGELDYLIIDTPPGTSDEHISIAEYLKDINPDGAVIVTTPQTVALADVRKELNFCKKVKLPILGVVENMSGYECTNLFSTGGGEAMAQEFGVEFLALGHYSEMVYYFTSQEVDPPALIYMGKDEKESKWNCGNCDEDLIKYGWEEDVCAHAYLRLQPGQSWEDISPKLLEDLGQLTKANSIKGCKEKSVDVLYTPWSNLLKTNGMATGEVSFKNNAMVKTLQIKKNNKIVNRLEKTRVEKFPDLEKEKMQAEKEKRRIAREAMVAKKQEELRLEQEKKEQEALKSYDSFFDKSSMRSNYDNDCDLEEDFM